MVVESSGVEEGVVDVVLEVSKSLGGATEVFEGPVGLSEPVRAYGAGYAIGSRSGLASQLGHTEPVGLSEPVKP